MSILICLLLLVLIVMDFLAWQSYRRLVNVIRELENVDNIRADWGLLATGHTGSPEFERLWLRTAQKQFQEIPKLGVDMEQ